MRKLYRRKLQVKAKVATLAIAAGALLAAPAAAGAATPSCDQYGNCGTHALAASAGGGTGVSGPGGGSGSTIGPLPFTGLDLGVMGGTALAMVGSGFALRRAMRRDSDVVPRHGSNG